MPVLPIWRDEPITVSTNESYLDYRILKWNGQVIYTGRAFRLPDATNITIVVNEVCAPHVRMTGAPTDSYSQGRMGSSFVLDILKEGYGRVIFNFANDYSYGGPRLVSRSNDPITNRIPRDASLWICTYNKAYNLGSTHEDSVEWTFSGQGVPDISQSQTYTAISYERKIDMPSDARYNKLAVAHGTDILEYEIVDMCWEYQLIYINAYGAWDTLAVEGASRETDEYARTTFKQAYNTTNASVQPRGTVNIQNDYVKKYSFVTGWLSDDQAARMHHLLGSTNVYVYDRVSGMTIPLVLTNSSCEYKTFRNQGAKLVNYTIEAEVAQNFTRR